MEEFTNIQPFAEDGDWQQAGQEQVSRADLLGFICDDRDELGPFLIL